MFIVVLSTSGFSGLQNKPSSSSLQHCAWQLALFVHLDALFVFVSCQKRHGMMTRHIHCRVFSSVDIVPEMLWCIYQHCCKSKSDSQPSVKVLLFSEVQRFSDRACRGLWVTWSGSWPKTGFAGTPTRTYPAHCRVMDFHVWKWPSNPSLIVEQHRVLYVCHRFVYLGADE